ncbi:MAG: hypothetical protein R3250_07980 [Melioribacteraceae bacterium]|nr:hypothetical protein [Melioribacteraceae bacterium]
MARRISTLNVKLIFDEDFIIYLNMEDLTYQERCFIQGLLWVKGQSFHNDIDGECCPDFSCCEPSLFEKDQKQRKTYINEWLNKDP